MALLIHKEVIYCRTLFNIGLEEQKMSMKDFKEYVLSIKGALKEWFAINQLPKD